MQHRWPAESRQHTDPDTGRTVRQITSHPSTHHHPFFFVEAFVRDMDFLVFVSHRTGIPQLFVEERESNDLIQLTDVENLSEWSIIPTANESWIYFVAGARAMRVDPATGDTVELTHLGAVDGRGDGMVGAAMGTTALSPSGRWWAIPLKTASGYRFEVVDTETGNYETILERDTIGHPQFCPDDDELILYAGPMTDRVWLVNRDGSNHRRLYEREHDMQWITHEVWWPGRRQVLFVDWPNGLRTISADNGDARWLSHFPVWHGAPDRDGNKLVCDTNFPDRGLHVLDLAGPECGNATFLLRSQASSRGEHWGGPFPYNNGPVKVYAPQHTHPHPRFSPDGRKVIFTSDRTGHAQLYEIGLNNER